MPGLHIDEVGVFKGGNPNNYIEGDYENLLQLLQNNSLVIGQKYLLKNYQHRYYIPNSDTATVDRIATVAELPYNYYHKLEGGEQIPYGSTVTITYLPENAPSYAFIGMTGFVYQSYADGSHYIDNIPLTVGMKIAYKAGFYLNNLVNDQVIRERFKERLTGTVSSVVGSDKLTGTGTLFTHELAVGDKVVYKLDANDYATYDRTVKAITSDTELTMTEVATDGNAATDSILDKLTFGRVIMKPGGLINTDVHDGKAYSGLSAEENMPAPVEQLVLTAISESEFSEFADSLTFKGDVVKYDMFNTEILDRSDNVIGTRNGFVTHRENKALNISLNQDWRAQRFRRFKIPQEYLDRLKMQEDRYKLDSDNHVYHVGALNVLSEADPRKLYFLNDIEKGFWFTDFRQNSKPSENPFTNGFQVYEDRNGAGEVKYGDFSAQGMAFRSDEFGFQAKCNFNNIEARDIPVIPLDENYNPVQVTRCIGEFENTVFQNLPKAQGDSEAIDVVASNLSKSTFVTGGILRSDTFMNEITCVEYFDIKNFGHLDQVISFSYSVISNYGHIDGLTIGGARNYPVPFIGRAAYQFASDCVITSSILGVGTTNFAKNIFKGTVAKCILFKYMSLGSNVFRINGAFMALGNVTDGEYTNNDWWQRSSTRGCTFELNPGWDKTTGIEYWLKGTITDKHFKTKSDSKSIFFETYNEEGRLTINNIDSVGNITSVVVGDCCSGPETYTHVFRLENNTDPNDQTELFLECELKIFEMDGTPIETYVSTKFLSDMVIIKNLPTNVYLEFYWTTRTGLNGNYSTNVHEKMSGWSQDFINVVYRDKSRITGRPANTEKIEELVYLNQINCKIYDWAIGGDLFYPKPAGEETLMYLYFNESGRL